MALDVRGTPAWLIGQYLERLGGVRLADGSYIGAGWWARLAVGEHLAFGAPVPRVVVAFEGEPEAVAAVESALRLRSMRGGG